MALNKETGILPSVDELVLGDTHKNLTELAKEFPHLETGLHAVRDGLDHVFQISYRLKEDIGLNPQNSIPKRAVPDMAAQRQKEAEKAAARREADLITSTSFADSIKRSKGLEIS